MQMFHSFNAFTLFLFLELLGQDLICAALQILEMGSEMSKILWHLAQGMLALLFAIALCLGNFLMNAHLPSLLLYIPRTPHTHVPYLMLYPYTLHTSYMP